MKSFFLAGDPFLQRRVVVKRKGVAVVKDGVAEVEGRDCWVDVVKGRNCWVAGVDGNTEMHHGQFLYSIVPFFRV